ncbi:PEPxxWA-CTERM sorting domain-containing protein [Sphingobium nicotianae]|uniref:PEPxxWA-CTERM sorting domain-containing protein n=1 Tax=Sphingobium nicotianae TaxID=2782607 RepID=A0A9X1DFT9_9SPHN|nr:PEPxxWA-CTERM sorting domain-containing protein [Sphingobium nicotianae]MBT2189236.1 PEPxxWA-CTERM sorting domain-containing protein [Sphingobium nicotianae]
MRRIAIALAALTAFAAPAHSAVVFSDNFDSENGGASALNYTGFANFTVVGGVDLVKSGDYSITCSGMCVDLDGTPGAGSLVSNVFNYKAGDKITLSFSVGGSQRVVGSDEFAAFIISSSDGIFGGSAVIPSSLAFTPSSVDFVASADGQLQFVFTTSSADKIGPLLDDISLDISGVVPEPATWALMIAGFAVAGLQMRRRKATLSFA